MGSRLKRIGNKIYDIGTANTSFLQLAKDLRTLGVKKWYFLLELNDPTLINVNPHAVDSNGNTTLTRDQIARVITECRRNLWYYLREVCRIPDPGNPKGVMYKANRGNIAQAFCILHGIDSWLCLPRQQGKTQSALAAFAWGYSFGTTTSDFIFVNKQQPDAKENLGRIKTQIDLLPEYMRFESYYDDETGKAVKAVNNATQMKQPVTKNTIKIRAGAGSRPKAVSLARGLTAPIIHYDEPEFTDYIGSIISNSVSTYETAARASEANGTLHARVFTCTPGDLDSGAGQEAQAVLNNTKPWTEKIYDMTKEEMQAYAKSGGSNNIIYIEFHYYQIGLDEEWLEKISNEIGDPLTVRREILLQRLHGSSLSPYPKEDIEYINDHAHKPISSLWIRDYYEFKIYEELDPAIPYILGIDCSTGTNQDHNAITALNPYTARPVAEFECSYVGETEYEQIIIELVTQHIPRSIVCIERNSVGDGIIDHLLNSKISHRLYFDRAKDLVQDTMNANETVESILKKKAAEKSYYGVYTDKESRSDMFAILADRIAANKDDFITANIIRDISGLVRLASGKIAAGPGSHDDSIMSYLIAMYVLIHGNNLPLFGYIPGEKEKTEPNRGLHRTQRELAEVLPEDVAEAIIEDQKIAKMMDYESILRQAILESQKETAKIMSSSISLDTGNVTKEEMTAFDEDYGSNSIDLDLFNELNGINTFEDDNPFSF
jgi:hypothetical protein